MDFQRFTGPTTQPFFGERLKINADDFDTIIFIWLISTLPYINFTISAKFRISFEN